MYPQPIEIDELGNAFIAISTPEYTPMQHKFLISFLKDYAVDLNKENAKKVFNDKISVIDALNVLNGFVNHYHDENEVITEFKDEIEHLILALNSAEEGLII
jgi:hypothetical protein